MKIRVSAIRFAEWQLFHFIQLCPCRIGISVQLIGESKNINIGTAPIVAKARMRDEKARKRLREVFDDEFAII